MTTDTFAHRTTSPAGDDALYRAAAEAAAVALLIVDDAGLVRGYNAACEHLLLFAPDQVLGKPIEVLQPDQRGGLPLLLGVAAPDGPLPERRFLPFRRADGALVTIDVAVTTTTIDHGPATGSALHVAVLREADLLSGLTDSWTEAEERLGVVAANLPGIVFQRVLQPDGTLYYPFFSAGVRDCLGVEPEDMRITRDGCLDAIHWADRDDYMRRLYESVQTLEPYTEDLRVISRDGQVKWLSGTMRPERMPSGDIIWDCVLIDVTDRMRAELRLEMIMDHAADCIVTINDDSIIESVNAATARTFGYDTEELLGHPVTILMPPDEAAHHTAHVEAYRDSGVGGMVGRGPRELRARHKDGSEFPIELALSEVLTEGRRIYIAIIRDIAKRKQTEARLHETEERLLNIADNIQGIVFQQVMRPNGEIAFTYVSEGARSVLGVEPRELINDGEMFLDLVDPADRGQFLDAMHRSSQMMTPMESDLKIVTRQGEERWLRSWSKPWRMADGGLVWDGVALDVTDRKRAEDELRFLAYYDPLTGLGNRALFGERFGRAKIFAERLRTWVAVLSVGLDRFSIINATCGHSTGDKVLKGAARRLQQAVDVGDLTCRAGGDRFLVLLTGISDLDEVDDVVRDLQRAFAEPVEVEGQEFDLTISVGAAICPRDGDTAETLIMHADAALHRAKDQGPSSRVVFTEEMGQRAAQTLSMQHRLRRALDNQEFVAYFQPQIETRSGRIVGMEALARWISPEHGLIPPGVFIETAEEYGLIDAMCDQVLHDACRWNRRWQDMGLAHVPVAVNISGRQFHNSRLLLNMVDTVLRECDMHPRYLELELTESSAMSDPENAINVVRLLAERGVSCAIDDFGTGYSSLSVLKRFPIRKLKIDRSFVNEVTTDPGDAAIVCAMIAMANALDLKVVAEGVETQDHLDFLHGVGCDQVQGFYFSKPLPGEEMERMFAEGAALPRPN